MLSPDIVVERKALPDLFASLGSGRLYNQVRLTPHSTMLLCAAVASDARSDRVWHFAFLFSCDPARCATFCGLCSYTKHMDAMIKGDQTAICCPPTVGFAGDKAFTLLLHTVL